MLELLVAGAGTIILEVATTATERTLSGSRARETEQAKAKEICYNCRSLGNFPKGKSKGKGFQGELYDSGDAGHSARERQKGKGGGKSRRAWGCGKGKGEHKEKGKERFAS